MPTAVPYLTLPGTCAEAVHRWAEIFRGEVVTLQTVGEAPVDAGGLADDKIFNAVVVAGDMTLRASDNPSGEPVGGGISIFVTLDDEAEATRVFDALADGGGVLFPLQGGFGMCHDRFGVHWMVTFGAH